MSGRLVKVETARSGHLVIKKNDRFLSSSFDPVKEASAWVEHAAGDVIDADSIVILGAGSGYHIEALRARFPQKPFLIVEPDEAVAEQAQEICHCLRREAWLIEPETSALIEHAKLRDFLAARYSLLKHPSSFQIEPQYFGFVEKLLIGRDKIGFLLLLKTRPELYSLLEPSAIQRFAAQDERELVSVKTIQKLFSNHATCSRERRMWKVLEELVV